MKLRALGQSEVRVTPIGLGCWQFSDGKGFAGKFWPSLQDVPSQEIIRVTLEGGVNWFDTAEMYGHGASERCLAAGLRAAGKDPGEVVIATKWYPAGRRASSMLATIDDRKQYLDGFPIDLYQIHLPLSLSSITAEMKAMAQLHRQGDIRAAGVSNYSATQMRRAHQALTDLGLTLASNQVQYSLLHRRIESNDVLETAQELGITVIAYSPLAQGLLTGKFHDDPSLIKTRVGWRKYTPSYWKRGLAKSRPVIVELKRLAAKYEVTPAQIALNWLIHAHGETVVAIPGATKVTQAEQNTGALKFTLSKNDLDGLDEVSRPFK